MMEKRFLTLWVFIVYLKTAVTSAIHRTPQLHLKAEVTPKSDISGGDTVTLSAEISHTKKSFADAVDVELSLACPAYTVFGSHTSSLPPQNITKGRNDQVLKFSNILLSTQLTVTIATSVDPYYMLASRDEVTASCMVTLSYYGVLDSCRKPGSKWDARSASFNARFSFTTKAAWESQLELHESYFSASSFQKAAYNSLGESPHNANFAHNLIWTPADTEDIHQYLQIEFNQLMRITKIGTKGNGQLASPKYVRKFSLYYSQDVRDWAMAYAAFQSHEFVGNNDCTTVKLNILKIPIDAKFVRIVPKLWKDKIALKVQLFGYPVYQVPSGYQPLGMSSGRIEDNKITVLSGNKDTYKPYHARLDFFTHTGGWCTNSYSKQTLTVDLEDNYVIAGIAVQSKYQSTNKLMKQFQIAYKENGGAKAYIKENGQTKTFLGNPIEDVTIRHKFLKTILARHVYFEPKTLSSTGCLRLELYGHKQNDEYISEYCTIFDFEGDLSLNHWDRTGSAFDNQPTFVDNLHARTSHAVNHEGEWWIGTRENRGKSNDIPGGTQGNYPIGTLTSPGFIISGSKLYFLFAGTADQAKSRVELLVDGLAERTAFSDTGNESLVPMSWDVKELLGKEAQIRIVDSGSDAFVSFDGLKSNCHLREELLPIFERSFLLNRLNNTLYLCHSYHASKRKDLACRLTIDNGRTWKDLSHVAGLLGINEVTGELYGVSMDRRDRLVNKNWFGRGIWSKVKDSDWNKVKDSLYEVVEIPNIPFTGLVETDQPMSVFTLVANSGDRFSASSLGVHHRSSSGGSWSIIATWRCKEYPDVCVSSPCNNGGVCHVTSDGGYNCTCPLGYTGDICDHDVDDCAGSPCLNGGQCVDGFNMFYCVCNSFYTGERCERDIDDCSTSACSPGSTCIDGLGNFTCQCLPGFVGEFCQMEADECASMPCQHGGHCVDHVNSYTCHCRQGYSGINCEHVHTSAFEVLGTASVVYESSRYTVVHARIPQDGRSRHQTWCHDYSELCYSLNKTRPTGCGRSSNHITEMHQCQTMFDSVMSHNNTLACPPNEKVSLIAKMAGFSTANPTNSFAFSNCDSSTCTDTLPNSGCHGALYCINQANRDVFTLCTDPESNFKIEDKGYTTYKGVNYLALYVKPLNTSSRHENWCRDYQRLCESYGKRPTGCGIAYSGNTSYSSCRDEYYSIMPVTNDLGCGNNMEKVVNIARNAGMPSTTESLTFYICGSFCKKDFPVWWASKHTNYIYHALCTEPLSSFTVLEERWTVFNNINFLVIKARLPRDRKSTQEDWCRDYATLCESYGLRPTGSDIIQDHEYTSCRDKYGSVMIDGVFFGSTPQSRIASIAQQTGFASANTDNSFGLDKCARCPTVLTNSDCEGMWCIKPSQHDDVYTMCVKPQSKINVLERKTTTYNKKAYLVMKVKVIEGNLSKWDEKYTTTCSHYGRRDIACKNMTENEMICNQADVMQTIALNAGFADAMTSNIYNPNSFKSTPSTEDVYLLCEGSDSNFEVISTKSVEVHGQEYLFIETTLPENGLARHKTWCEDYRELCYSYGQRPVSCGTESGGSSHFGCRDTYDAILPRDNPTGLLSYLEIISLANQAGYLNASINNSFAFSICNESACTKDYSNAIALHAGMITSSIGRNQSLYTLCLSSNTSFIVESSRNVSYQGGSYKIIKARIPFNHISKQRTWCHDYQSLCNSYGWRPLMTSHDADVSCKRNHGAISPKRDEVSSTEKLEYLVKTAGYENANVGNIFAFRKKCKDSCFAKILNFSSATEPAINLSSNLISKNNDVVFAVCINSDTNFHVLDSSRINYQNRSYLVLKTRIPPHGVSKYENWCADYQRLCDEYEMRPVSILSLESNVESHDSHVGSCVPGYMSIVVPKDKNLTLFTREQISIMANSAGYHEASRDNSFAFNECNPKSCSRFLDSKCAPGLDCLWNEPRQLYTVCTDSNSNFIAKQTRHIKHEGVPYLLIRSSIPEEGISKHQNWCLDYKNLCNSFGMQPVLCESPHDVSSSSNCSTDFSTTSNSCELKKIDVLRKLTDESFIRNSSVFMPARCDNCNQTMWESCQNNSNCPEKIKTTLTFCTALQNNFKILETRQTEHQNVRLTIVKAKVISNGTSYDKNWGYDYNRMCSSLGKRPYSCPEPGNFIQYKNQKEYNIFLSEGCSDILELMLLPIHAGFSQVKNVLLFESSLVPTGELISRHLSEDFAELNPKKCCKCLNSSGDTVSTSVVETTLVTLMHKNSSFAGHWKACVERGATQTLTENCDMARDCFNDTQLANNTCDVISDCYHNNCTECCSCDIYQLHMSGCPTGKKCSSFNFSEDVYAFCSEFSNSNFEVEDTREVVYADQPYTVVKAHVLSHGQSRSETWCEDYKLLCQAIGKRPLGCGKDFEIWKQSRDCRIRYDAIMMEEMSCPDSEEFAAIARHAGFPASANESLGLWNCEMCSKNFSINWNRTYSLNGTNVTHYITNTSFDVYLLCAGSDSNFNVLEKRAVQHKGSSVSVLMTTIPHHGESFHENWCVDYSRLCQSYGLRPIGCGKSADNKEEYAQCRDGYNALMYSDDTIDCLEKFNVHEIAQSAGFTTATSQNSFIFKSCLPQHCTKFLPSAEHPFTQFEVDSTNRVFYTLCASSDSAYEVIATKPVTIAEQDYLVIRATIPVGGQSKHINWCEDYKRLCEGYAMKPLTCKGSSGEQRECIYNFGSIPKTNADLACPAKTGVASIAKQVGFDHVNDTNSFAMDLCDLSKSCVAKMPNFKCVDTTHYDSWFETNATQVQFTRADYIVNITKTILKAVNETLNVTETIIVPEARHCLTFPNAPNGEPPYKINGELLTDMFQSNRCEWNFDLNGPGVSLFFFNVTVNQTFEHKIPRVETNCWLLSTSSLARMSGEVNTVCLRPGSDTSFRVQSTRTITNSGRKYLIIQAKVLSAVSKSINWCMEYANLCKAFQSSPLACPRRFGFNTDHLECLTDYGAIMMNDVDYACPSNGFVSRLARTAGYSRASLSNSFSLSNCNDAKCTSKLPLTGCSDAVHCLSHEVLHDHVYTACVVSNSDSNFNVIEKREKRLYDYDYTMIRARLPVNGAPLFDSWCEDYQRLCESFNLRPLHCIGGGLSANEYGVCKQKYNSVFSYNYGCPTQVHRMARSAGFVGPSSKNSFAFHRCTMCSKNFHTSNCDKALSCITTNIPFREVYTGCRETESESSFHPLATKLVRHGRLRLRVVQAKVISQSTVNSDWGKDYKKLCGYYNEVPTGCGVVPGESSPGVSDCGSKYSSFVLHGDELGCNPNGVIAKLARKAGFVNARPNNSFGFSHCNGSSVSQLSSTCHSSLPCLTWTPENPIVYTVCVNQLIESNFRVLDAKSITFNHMDYLVIRAQIPEDGKSYKANWCQDYKELCVSYDMLPTGCGGDNTKYSNYSSCGSQYGSYMPANDILGCGDTKIVSNIAKKAGFKDAIPANSFVFYNCDDCTSELTNECDGALHCINNIVWQRQVYTVCVNPTTVFNVRSASTTIFNNTNHLVLEAKLPSDGRAQAATWCREYENLCQNYNARPLICHQEDSHVMECAKKYSAKKSSFSCDGKDVSNIAIQAGFLSAKQGNTFILNNCNSCSKELASSGCDDALSCINSNLTDYVYVICIKENSNFKDMDSQKVSISGAVYTVVSALLPERTSSTWCKDYSELCHTIGQSPTALHSGIVTEQLLKCRDDYDAVLQTSNTDIVHQIAAQAGFNEAEYGNTFAFKGCAYESCQNSPYLYNCSNSLYCLNGVTRKVYALCVENTQSSNFYVLENKTLYSNDTTYAVLRVRIPMHRLSKFESWCRDYERLCHAHNMRPLTSLSSRECSVEYFSIYASKFSPGSLIKVVHLAGFPNATASDIYSLEKCSEQECGRQFQIPHCGSCTMSANQRRVFYAVCGSLDENLQTNFEIQNIRDVWFDAAFLVAQVRIPLHRQSKTENWCREYQTFCKSYDRQPYTSKSTIDACSWNYNATTHSTVISPGAIVERAGFNASTPACVSSLYDCNYCAHKLDSVQCPFENCQAVMEICDDFYIICT